MTQAVAEDTETSLTEGMESMGVREADKADKLNQGVEEKETENDKMGETNETAEETQKEEEEDKDKDTAEDGQKDEVKCETSMEIGEAEEQKGEDDWEIPYSDEEMEEPKSWMPPPQEIKRLYELLAKGDVLELNWVALPRRAPTPPRTPSPERDGDESLEPKEEENQNRSLTPTEFDFDEEQTPKNAFINRRRTPGSSARSSVRREARMDKVLSDIKRHRRIDEQLLRSGRDLFKSDKSRPAAVPKEPLSPNSQRERERDRDPSTVFSPRQRRY